MPGNSFGQLFRITTWGESHGTAVGVVIDGCPPRLELSEADIQKDLDARRPGRLPWHSPRQEPDRVRILSGVFEGKTTGTPISLMVDNRDPDSEAYEPVRNLLRPGQADFTYWRKYGIRDHRGGGRASARETVGRVAAGAIADKILAGQGMEIRAFTIEIGGIGIETFDPDEAAQNPLLCPDRKAAERMIERLSHIRSQGDSLGGVVEIRVSGCPAGLGEPVFDKLDADLAQGIMSIGAVKGVEIGAGFQAARLLGSQINDPLTPDGFASNQAGGILGGISNGEEVVIRAAVKPIPSISLPQKTITLQNEPVELRLKGRHDACAIPRILPVCRAMTALVLVDHLLRQKALQ